MTKPNEIVDALLKGASVPTKHMMHDHVELVGAIHYFLELKRTGDPAASVSLPWFYRMKLRERFDGPRWYGTVRAYVRDVMKLDPNTGEAL